jgi:hypothetical protein
MSDERGIETNAVLGRIEFDELSARREERHERILDVPIALTFDDVLLVPSKSDSPSEHGRHEQPADAGHPPQHSDHLGGDGHGDRGEARDRDGAAGRDG